MSGFDEKDFYLDEFRGRTLVIAVDRQLLRAKKSRRRLAAVVRDLVDNTSRVVVVLGDDAVGTRRLADPHPQAKMSALREWIGLPRTRARKTRKGGSVSRSRRDTVAWSESAEDAAVTEVWHVLRVRWLCIVVADGPAFGPASRIAARLRVHKLVLLDRAGGLIEKGTKEFLSYLDGARLDVLLAAGEAEFHGFGERRALLTEIDEVLEHGVSSVNLCSVDGLARELFTYEGSGTFFSRDDHCYVRRLSIDDFHEVERLIARGQEEGLLKPRSVDEIAELLLDGFGVWLAPDHLAGIGALHGWNGPEGRVAEVTGLYTFTRFKGEGIGERLLERLLEEARNRDLAYAFAVTTAERAARFFQRQGFRQVTADEVPAEKWEGYEASRRSRVRVFRYELRPARSIPAASPREPRRRRSAGDSRETPSAG